MKRTKVSRLMPFGKFKGMGIDEMEEDYMKKFVKYKRFTSNKGFMDRVRKSKFSYLVKDKKKDSIVVYSPDADVIVLSISSNKDRSVVSNILIALGESWINLVILPVYPDDLSSIPGLLLAP